MEKIKVFLIHDYDALMDNVESMLSDSESIVVVGEANSAALAVQLIRTKMPDIVLADVSVSEKVGADLTKLIKREFPKIKVIVLSMQDDFINISKMIKSGANGYLLKNVKFHELHKAINKVMLGETYIQNSITAKFINGYQRENHTEEANVLSPREVEIIRLIAKEYTSADIGRMLFISEHTVETHRKNIWRKTGVKSIVGLLNFAHEHQLI
ncbi:MULTISPECIES: response regulator transcription factor [unclassified Pedobacter]|uniref:response regulator n=1 Tax=unclassified Pedobacter TaxID=2628915 RepID=UPI001DC24B28|nr:MULTISPECIES: response regulator transcription factor [unclassified Pedobacter]CAH0293950.1 Oxygen regulatory protein NreC [Pedobacter sp. Bi36]CAH0305039.1 Oxygen regulatory protein NreC [Pedobacter sp. Bi126]